MSPTTSTDVTSEPVLRADASVKVSIAGASGYSGSELVRLLLTHPNVELVHLAAGEQSGRELAEVFPQYRDLIQRTLCPTDWDVLGRDSDVVMLGLPHGLSMAAVPGLLEGGARVVDLGGDFRLRDPSTYSSWYGLEHTADDLLARAVYGLPELNEDAIRTAELVANPGCYPTASILALLPIADLLGGTTVVVDAKSGVSGAGRKASMTTHFSEVNENIKAYSVLEHRHTPEIEQVLADASGKPSLVFVPHLVPMTRGILATCYVTGIGAVDEQELVERYRSLADRAPVRALPGRRTAADQGHLRLQLLRHRSAHRRAQRDGRRDRGDRQSGQRCGRAGHRESQSDVWLRADRGATGGAGVSMSASNRDGQPNESWIEGGGVATPRGFRAAGVHCGIKQKRLDLALLEAHDNVPTAGMYTTNRVVAAPVVYCRESLAKTSGRARAVVVQQRQRQRLHRRSWSGRRPGNGSSGGGISRCRSFGGPGGVDGSDRPRATDGQAALRNPERC